MYVTPNPNFRESLVFLRCARDALSAIVEDSTVDYKDELSSFLLNEASDYEIMSLLINNELPDNKFDLKEELMLFATLKEQMIATPGLDEFLGEDIYNKVMLEVDTLAPYQSAPVLMEKIEKLISEVSPTLAGLKGVGKTAVKYWEPKAKTGLTALKKSFERPSIVKDKMALQRAAAQSKTAAAGPSPLTAQKGTAKWWLSKAKTGAKSAKQAVSTFAKSPAGKAVGGAALAALALYGAHKLYKNFMSKAARACSGTGKAKAQCMDQYKARALGAEIKDLNAAKAACKATKDPGKCASAIQGKISRLQSKQAKLRG